MKIRLLTKKLLLSSPTPPELRLHARSYRHHLIDLHIFLSRIHRVTSRVEFLGGLEDSLRAEGSPGVVAGEEGLEFADDLLGCGFRNQAAL